MSMCLCQLDQNYGQSGSDLQPAAQTGQTGQTGRPRKAAAVFLRTERCRSATQQQKPSALMCLCNFTYVKCGMETETLDGLEEIVVLGEGSLGLKDASARDAEDCFLDTARDQS